MKKIVARALARRLSRYVAIAIAKHNVRVIAVTGSVGKTSARVAIARTLSEKFSVPPVVEHSYNVPVATEVSFFGLDLPRPIWNVLAWQWTLARIRRLSRNFPYEVVVLEINEDEFEQMEYFFERVKVDYAVITAVAPAHMAHYKSIDEIAQKVLKITQYADQIIYNADFEELNELSDQKNTKSYGFADLADVRFTQVQRNSDGCLSANLRISGESEFIKINTKQISEQGLYALLAAAAVATEYKMTIRKIANSIEDIVPVRGRMNILAGINKTTIIDDSYNSSPKAAIAALKTLEQFPSRKIAVLGSMNEMGDYAKEAHVQVAREAAKIADLIVTVGVIAGELLAPEAKKAGLNQDKVKSFRTPYEAGHYLKEHIKPHDTILVKGSQNGVFTEEVARILLDDSLDPDKVLIRQSAYWKKAKKQAFRI